MATDKANYGGKQSGMHEGLKTKSPPVNDSSRRPIGSVHSTSVDAKDRPDGVGEVKPSTLGPRTA
jgi:hypothetical protein